MEYWGKKIHFWVQNFHFNRAFSVQGLHVLPPPCHTTPLCHGGPGKALAQPFSCLSLSRMSILVLVTARHPACSGIPDYFIHSFSTQHGLVSLSLLLLYQALCEALASQGSKKKTEPYNSHRLKCLVGSVHGQHSLSMFMARYRVLAASYFTGEETDVQREGDPLKAHSLWGHDMSRWLGSRALL